jgi:hypothetical protein
MGAKKGSAIRLTQAQVDAHQARMRKPAASLAPAVPLYGGAPAQTAKEKMQARGRLPVGVMNKTEAEYDAYLADLQQRGVIVWRRFEGIKLRLADNTFYTPDFGVMLSSGLMELHEVKGHWTDDARVKIKVAAALYPYQFVAVQKRPAKDGGGWTEERF